jgi:hypothetical protein
MTLPGRQVLISAFSRSSRSRWRFSKSAIWRWLSSTMRRLLFKINARRRFADDERVRRHRGEGACSARFGYSGGHNNWLCLGSGIFKSIATVELWSRRWLTSSKVSSQTMLDVATNSEHLAKRAEDHSTGK